ncbi:Pentapeptide_repeats-containing protein [Hexamita inflata]|uniref:Pentapeptide repeats-containing protein n=1 Tax=Hexamita inflata TaxID=28002 RepID=A0AA86NPV3_9EUKA|nr:Pentapeptide repeats-containing protein [Hexamita inflata]
MQFQLQFHQNNQLLYDQTQKTSLTFAKIELSSQIYENYNKLKYIQDKVDYGNLININNFEQINNSINELTKHLNQLDEQQQGSVKQTHEQLNEVQGGVKQTHEQLNEVQGGVKQTHEQLNEVQGSVKRIVNYIQSQDLQTIEQKVFKVQQEQCDCNQRVELLNSYVDLKADLFSFSNLNGVQTLNISQNLSSFEIAKQFIEDQNQKVLLITGDIGTGKTLFSYYLTSQLLQNKQQDQKSVLPIYIYLPELSNQNQIFDSSNKLYFETQYKELKITDIEYYLCNSKNYILILDGFYETRCIDKWKNMYNQLQNKVIVTCRSQYTNQFKQYKTVFCDNKHKLCEMNILPFDETQISKYLQLNTKKFDSQQYYFMNNAIKDINSLIKTPLILSQFVKSIPELVQNNHSIYSKQQTRQINKFKILEHIILQWFNREEYKLVKYGGWHENQFESFSCMFALDLHNKQLLKYDIKLDKFKYLTSQYNAKNTKNSILIMSRMCAPITLNNDEYCFICKEIRDYFIYLGLIKNLLKEHNKYNKEKQVYFEQQNVEYQKLQFNFNNFTFNQILIQDKDVLNYFVAKTLIEKQFETMLHNIIKQSKYSNNINIASANSMTILNQANIVFIDEDFSNIKIPGANIKSGQFFNCSFKGADLKGCKLQFAYLRNCNFSNANLKNVDFGQYPDLIGHSDQVNALTGDINTIYSASSDNTVKQWHLSSGKCIKTIKFKHKQINIFAFSSDRLQFCTGSKDGTIKLWETNSSKCKYTYNDQIIVENQQLRQQILVSRMSSLNVIQFSQTSLSHDNFICTGAEDGTINIFKVLDNRMQCILCIQGYFNNNQSIWPNNNVEKYTENIDGHKSSITSLCFSSNNQYVCSGSKDQSIKLWSLQTENFGYICPFEQHQDQVSALCFSLYDKYIISGSWDKTIKVWNLALKKCVLTLKGHVDIITSICVSDDGQYIYSGSNDNTIKVWQLQLNQKNDEYVGGQCINTLIGHKNQITSLFLQKDILMSGSKDNLIKIWKTCPDIQNNENHMNKINHLIFSHGGQYLCSASIDGVIKLWETQNGNSILSICAHSCTITAICFSFNDKYICSGSEDGYVKVWDLDTGQCIKTLIHLNKISAVSFSQDNEYVCSGCMQTIYLQQVTGTYKETFKTQNNISQLFFNSEENNIYVLVEIENKCSVVKLDVRSKQFQQHQITNTNIDYICLLYDNNILCYTSKEKKQNILYFQKVNTNIKCILNNHQISQINLTTDQENICVTYQNGDIQIFSNEGKCIQSFKTISNVNSIFYSEQKKYIASCEFNVVYLLNEKQKLIWKSNNNMLDLRKDK